MKASAKTKSRLVYLLAGAVGLYHLSNLVWVAAHFQGFEGTRPFRKAGLSLEVPKARWSEEPMIFEASRRGLAATGFTIRYLLGEENGFYFFGRSEPYQSAYVRNDVDVMVPDLGAKSAAYLEHVSRWFGDLRCLGALPLGLFVPPKAVLERNRVPTPLPTRHLFAAVEPALREDTWVGERVIQEQPDDGILNLFHPLKRQAAKPGGPALYVPWDYHLSSYGMGVVVAELVRELGRLGEPIGNPRLVQTSTRPLKHDDVLVNILRLPEWFLQSAKPFAWVEPFFEVRVTGKLRKYRRVVYLGTSFSQRLDADGMSLPKVLEKALGIPVVTARRNGSTVDTIAQKLVDEDTRVEAGDIVVLEQPFDHVLREVNPIPRLWAPGRALATGGECERKWTNRTAVNRPSVPAKPPKSRAASFRKPR